MADIRITRIGTGKPDDLKAKLLNRNSAFYKDESVQKAGIVFEYTTPNEFGVTYRHPLVEKLLKLAQGGTNVYPHNFNTRTPEELGITAEELRSIGYGTELLSLMVTVKDSAGKEVQLIPGEFNAWQGTLNKTSRPSKVPPGADQPIDVWAKSLGVMIQDSGPSYSVGEKGKDGYQKFDIESPVGFPRTVAAGRLMTRKYSINYGSEDITDADKTSPTFGHPLIVGGDGALDVNIPTRVLDQIKQGKAYYGPVQIKLRTEEGRSDPKVFFLSDARGAILAEMDNWQDDKRIWVSEVAGVKFDKPIHIQESLFNSMKPEKVGYMPMSGAQYQAWKYALSENADIRSVSPEKWMKDTFGSRAQFDAVFKKFPDGELLTREQYHAVLEGHKQLEAACRAVQGCDTGKLYDVPSANPVAPLAIATQLATEGRNV